jgi:hypothetical protein
MSRPGRRWTAFVSATLLWAVAAGGATPGLPSVALTAAAALTPTAASPVIAAAGDIACDPKDASFRGGAGTSTRCRMVATSDVLTGLAPAAVLPLGDTQYNKAAPSAYQQSYRPSWGRLDAIAHPVPGNHEYQNPGPAGYFAYFGTAAGSAPGWYSWDVGAWHMVALNSNCAAVGGCGPGSPQEQWLRADLAAHPAACTLAYWHHAPFSSSRNGDDPSVAPLFRALYDAAADVVLSGHNHQYERFAPLDPNGRADAARGVRSFVVGTGGKNLENFPTVRPGSEARSKTFGVLGLTLHPGGYDWQFHPVAGSTFSDTGSGACH